MLDVFLDTMVRAGRIDGPAKPWLPPAHRQRRSFRRRQAWQTMAQLLRTLRTGWRAPDGIWN